MSHRTKEVPAEKSLRSNPAVKAREHKYFLALLIAAIAIRIWRITWGLPELYEEAIPLHFSLKLWDIQQSPIDNQFFVYPALSYYIQFALQCVYFIVGYVGGSIHDIQGFLKLFESNPAAFVIIGRLVSVAFDAGSIILVYVIGLRLFNRWAGLVAAFFLSINVLHVSESHLINVDTVLTFFLVLLLYFLRKVYTDSGWRPYILTGITLGLATSTKYNAGVLAVAFLAVHLLKSSSSKQLMRQLIDKRLYIGLASSAVLFLALNPLILTHFDAFYSKLEQTQTHMEYGHLGIDTSVSTPVFYLSEVLPLNLGWPLTVVIFAGVLYLLFSRKKENYILLLIPLIMMIVLGAWQMRADRYIMPIFPNLILIGSVLLAKLREFGTKRGVGLAVLRPAAFMGILLIAAPSFVKTYELEKTYSKDDTRALAKAWIAAHVRPGAAIATGPFGLELSKTQYITLPIQFTAVASEALAPFYTTRWYEDIDLVVASDFDYGRYIREPQRYSEMIGFYDTLRTTWELVFQASPGEKSTGPTLWIYRYKGPVHSEFDPILFERLQNVDPERVLNFLGKLGLILSSKNILVKSEQALKKVVEIDPANSLALQELTKIEFKQEKFDEALQYVNEVLKLNPALSSMTTLKGDILLGLGRVDEAEMSYATSIKLNSRDESAYLGLITIYAYQDETEKLVSTLENFKKLSPASVEKAKLIIEAARRARGAS
ncbi:MAG TPA: glycosyltransferase family 39 protein [Bacteroidota bacterium]|nr:glycosyltransferase family 39 protein [Bacteroidota bacterium]